MTPPFGREGRGNKELLDEGEEEWKVLLKTQHAKNEDHRIWSHHFMTNRWENNGNSDGLYFLGLQNHWVSDYSHEVKRRLLLRRKAMTNLDSVLKSRDITLPTKVCLVKAMVFHPRSKYLLISWLQSPSAVILELKKIVCHYFHCFPICLPWSDGNGRHDLHFLNAEF